jgi:hypothetical protein
MDTEPPWTFNGVEFTDDDINGAAGFCYLIVHNETGRKYLGRKYFESKRKANKKAKRRTTTESDWKTYWGSSKTFSAEVETHGKSEYSRIILSIHKTRGDCNMTEVKEQFARNVLEDDSYANENISGKWRRTPKHIVEARRIAKD